MSLYTDASLIMYPSGYKEDKIYSLKPTDGSGDLTFTRASTATRVNADGLIEGVRTNLITYSEQFDNAAWTKIQISATANDTISPDGTQTAELITVNSGSVDGGVFRFGAWNTTLQTFSLFAKKGNHNRVQLGQASNDWWAIFDLEDGYIVSQDGNLTSSKIVDYGNGWYRCIVSHSNPSATATLSAKIVGENNSVYFWGAQLELSPSATEYIPTTTTAVSVGMLADVPRIDYTGGGCGKLLLEPQRTNLIPYSNAFNFWTLSGDGVGQSQTSNYAISPDGTNNATRLQLNKTGGSFSRLSLPVTGTIGGTSVTYTIYLKANIGTPNVYIQAGGNISSAINVTSEWTRYEIIGNAPGTTTTCFVGIADSVSGTSETADILIYGAQLEAGSYPTSLIPTTSTAVTRLADAASKTGISSLIGQTEGTLMVEVNFTDTNVDQTYVIISDGTSNNQISIGWSNALNGLIAFIRTGGSSQALMTLVSPASGVKKIAVGYKLNNCALYINGVLVASDSSAIMPACSRVDIGGTFTAGSEYPINQALLFPTRLTNTQLATLTTI